MYYNKKKPPIAEWLFFSPSFAKPSADDVGSTGFEPAPPSSRLKQTAGSAIIRHFDV